MYVIYISAISVMVAEVMPGVRIDYGSYVYIMYYICIYIHATYVCVDLYVIYMCVYMNVICVCVHEGMVAKVTPSVRAVHQ